MNTPQSHEEQKGRQDLHESQPMPRSSVLVALDGSPAAKMALPIARAVARQLDAQLEILHVAPTPLSEEAIRALLRLTHEEEAETGIHVCLGEPVQGILEVAHAPETQLIVLTTHGRNIEPGRGLGRVAEAIIATTSSPVLLIRPETMVGRERLITTIQRMLFPLDGMPSTFAALGPAIGLACRLRAAVDLLYVLSPGDPLPAELGSISGPYYVDQPQHEWPHWSYETTKRMIMQARCPREITVQAFLAFGDIATEVLGFLEEHAEDVIVLVRRSHFEVDRARVLRAVLNRMPCPVLLLAVPSPVGEDA